MNICLYQNIALTIVRLLLGITFILHGSQKVLGLFGGSGLAGFASYVATLGYPAWLGYMASFNEFFGGLLLVLGIVPELGAALIIPVMLVAIFNVHFSKGFFSHQGGYEYALNLLILALVVIIGGAGKWTLFDYFQKWR